VTSRLAIGIALIVAGTASVPALAGGVTAVGIQNGASERSFSLSRTKVPPGPSIVQYHNTGEDPHDLKIRRKGTEKVLAIGELQSGEVGELTPKLKPDSKYTIWCSLDGHRQSGMKAVLTVKKK
jgi:plastocyanin